MMQGHQREWLLILLVPVPVRAYMHLQPERRLQVHAYCLYMTDCCQPHASITNAVLGLDCNAGSVARVRVHTA